MSATFRHGCCVPEVPGVGTCSLAGGSLPPLLSLISCEPWYTGWEFELSLTSSVTSRLQMKPEKPSSVQLTIPWDTLCPTSYPLQQPPEPGAPTSSCPPGGRVHPAPGALVGLPGKLLTPGCIVLPGHADSCTRLQSGNITTTFLFSFLSKAGPGKGIGLRPFTESNNRPALRPQHTHRSPRLQALRGKCPPSSSVFSLLPFLSLFSLHRLS